MPTAKSSSRVGSRKKQKEPERADSRLNLLFHEVKMILVALAEASGQPTLPMALILDEEVKIKDFGVDDEEDVEKASKLLGFRLNCEDSVLDLAGEIRKSLVH